MPRRPVASTAPASCGEVFVTAETAADGHALAKAQALADRLSLPFRPDLGDLPSSFDFALVLTQDRLELRDLSSKRSRPLYVDFLHGALAQRRLTGQSRRQPLARAVGLSGKSLAVVDATAGLARDAFLLACLGCSVTAVERSPILFALVEDALRRVGEARSVRPIVDRMRLILGDARKVLPAAAAAGERPDVVYLDPMYASGKRSAASKKEMEICRRLVGDDTDAGELLTTAMAVAKKRVVVKRHPSAPPLASPPSHTILGRTVRYDVYLLPPAPTGSGNSTSKSSSNAAS